MKSFGRTRRAMLGTALTVLTMGSAAVAQQDAAIPPPPKPGVKEVVVNCCKCLGQESGAVSINTGAAPWMVSSTPTPPWQTVAQWQANPGFNGVSNPSPLVYPGNIGVNPLPNVWTNALAPAAWLQPNASTTMGSYANGHYTYKLRIRVPNCTIKQKVVISGRIAADDLAKMYVDGSGGGPVLLSSPPPYAGFGTAGIKTFSHTLSGPGVYTLRVEVDNLGGGPTGIVVNGTANGKCDDRMEKGRDDRD